MADQVAVLPVPNLPLPILAQPEDLSEELSEGRSENHSERLGDWDFRDPKPDENPMISYSSPTVTLLVGPEKVAMMAHRAFLTNYDGFFATCLKDDRFAEGMKNKISLPDEETEKIGKILMFLYTGKLWSPLPDSVACPSNTELVEFYTLADKYCLKELANIAVNYVGPGRWCQEPFPWSLFKRLNDSVLRGSMMWSKLVEWVCREILSDHNSDEYLGELRSIVDGLGSDPSAAIDFLREISDIRTARAGAVIAWAASEGEAGASAHGWDNSPISHSVLYADHGCLIELDSILNAGFRLEIAITIELLHGISDQRKATLNEHSYMW
ncbi:uncharacterized protein A1O9_00208 [Exophiala aquamarina CBS 119918]|uniref:BTB domain-containing protein n=1 Tax=Exophiala aquamarina CBS 119918 TaxID=1182545 RepID=A0A072PQV0_9EURO|nr:uncharacterized protein A1O9_00208 [Exophiala aquamarina CBS 119918]KEF62236.1 hypothetical protein A1O9_00208 [Exophiala aquamarina CBS 119918]